MIQFGSMAKPVLQGWWDHKPEKLIDLPDQREISMSLL
jgi:hypothetical protein